jgi:methyl-accepting chemotaxis protein
MGMVLFLGIILLLSVSSAYYLNRLSDKTNAILKENHFSVVYARNMSESLTKINQQIISCLLTDKQPDASVLNNELMLFDRSLQLEKNNITEPGEGDLVSVLEKAYFIYRDSVRRITESRNHPVNIQFVYGKFDTVYNQLMQLSHLNETAIENKTDDAKVSAKKATFQMTFIGTICFLIAYGFTFVFSSYFNQRFYSLYNGIKEIVSGNYSKKLYIDGKDELSDISVIFNEMAEKINTGKQKISVTVSEDSGRNFNPGDIQELKDFLIRIRRIEEETKELISKFEKK